MKSNYAAADSMFQLRDYQSGIPTRVFKYIKDNPGKHPLIAMPTGSGKTVVLSEIILQAVSKWNAKVLVISHVKEILDQDEKAIRKHTGLDVGIYSAGLGLRDIHQVTVAGIQSIYTRGEDFKDFQLIIIDECHLIPPNGNSMYRRFFAALEKPRYLGLTATPYRLGSGPIHGPEGIFDDLVVDLTRMEQFNRLIEKGYLCRLKTKVTTNELSTEGIRTVGGDFDVKEMANTFNREAITSACVLEIIAAGAEYKKWLLFAIDIEHAESITEMLIKHGIKAMAVHSKLEWDRSLVLEMFRRGDIRAIVNVNVLTTGFDDPEIDLIALLRPTKSPVIHVQTIGRGLRIAPEKDHCLIMDFAGNTERNGPINDIRVKKKGKGVGGDPITKRCPQCDTVHHPSVRICEFCGHKFLFKTDLRSVISTADVIRETQQKWYTVTDVEYDIHQKKYSPDSVKVSYICGIGRFFVEYVCIEHPGWAGARGKHWVKFRGGAAQTVQELLSEASNLKRPTKILVDSSQKYPTIIDHTF